uniref:Uncharacterized protein n=1 Tax=Rhizophora mucronata TaxID=61149 RepID=A0A2P2K3J0_RHIMU
MMLMGMKKMRMMTMTMMMRILMGKTSEASCLFNFIFASSNGSLSSEDLISKSGVNKVQIDGIYWLSTCIS